MKAPGMANKGKSDARDSKDRLARISHAGGQLDVGFGAI
jgi:hypothetical protein